MILLLWGCAEPGTLGSVSAALAEQAVTEGELPLRTTTAVAGLLAETCGPDTVEGYAFTSRSAAALRAGVATVDHDETTQTWIFDDVGLDGTKGVLEVVTDGQQENLAVTYTADGVRFTAGLEIRSCDPDVPSAVLGGTGTWTTTGGAVAVTLLGAAPTNGLVWSPSTAEVPNAGQIRAADEVDGWAVLLDDASTLEAGADAWTGAASGDGWSHEVEIGWP